MKPVLCKKWSSKNAWNEARLKKKKANSVYYYFISTEWCQSAKGTAVYCPLWSHCDVIKPAKRKLRTEALRGMPCMYLREDISDSGTFNKSGSWVRNAPAPLWLGAWRNLGPTLPVLPRPRTALRVPAVSPGPCFAFVYWFWCFQETKCHTNVHGSCWNLFNMCPGLRSRAAATKPALPFSLSPLSPCVQYDPFQSQSCSRSMPGATQLSSQISALFF